MRRDVAMKLVALLLGVSLMLPPALAAAATSVFVMSLSAGKAQVVINRSAVHVMTQGQTSPEGVTLTSATPTVAQFIVDGRAVQLGLGQSTVVQTEIVADSAGNYFTTATINGVPVPAQIDTGATTVVLNATDAARLGVDYVRAPQIISQTANGRVRAYDVFLRHVQVGNIAMNNVRAAVLEGGPAQLSHVLIGMSFLQGIELHNAGRRMELIQKQF